MNEFNQNDFNQTSAWVDNAWHVSIVAGAAGDNSLKRKAWNRFKKLSEICRRIGWRVETTLANAHVVDPSGTFA